MGEQLKKMKAKVIHKHETEANWNLSNYIPDVGEIVFYDIDETHNYVRQKNGDGIHIVKELPFSMGASDFDVVITSEEEFKKCVYMLHPNKNPDGSVDLNTTGEATPNFDYRYILVRNVNFTEDLGTSDLDLAVFQPSIRYVKFDNCIWNTKWRISGKEPTTLKFTGTEYERAPGDLQLVVDGIHITETNIVNSITYANEHPDSPSKFWGIGLRNIKGVINCTVDYPEGYKVVPYNTGTESGYTHSFKLSAQYFDYADNNKITALWDGTNISNCHISEGLYRSSNCSNIVAMPILDENDAPAPIELRTCHNLTNFKGDFMDMVYGTPSYPECTAINYSTCDWTSNKEAFDFIIDSQGELTKFLQNPSSFQNKRILLKNMTLNTGNIDLTGAAYVSFSNVEINEGVTSLIGASVFECSGLRFVSTQCRLAFKGVDNTARPRVYNMGSGVGSITTGYCMYENCDSVSNSIIHFADKTNHIHGCIVKTTPAAFDSVASQDPWFRLCNDICGVTINSNASLIKFDRCTQLSHITGINAAAISYIDCTKIDVLTCDNIKSTQIAETPFCPKPNRTDVATGAFALYAQKHDGTNASKLAAVGNESGEISLGSGVVPIRANGGHLLVPITPTEGNHAVSMQYLDSKGYQSYSQIDSVFAKKGDVCPKPNRSDLSTGFALYAQKPDGSNGSKIAQIGNESGTISLGSGVIPIRASNGQLLVPITPTEANHAVSKQYLESKLSSSVDLTEYAKVSWVENNFLSGNDLDTYGFATETWVNDKNFAPRYLAVRTLELVTGGEEATNNGDINNPQPINGAVYYGGIYDSYALRCELTAAGITIKVPRIEVKTQAEYDALATKNETIIYIIKE